MIHAISNRPALLQFAGGKKKAPAAETGLPLYYVMTGGGDGSYQPHFFKSEAERDKAREWLDENDDTPADGDGDIEAKDVYQSAADFIAEQ